MRAAILLLASAAAAAILAAAPASGATAAVHSACSGPNSAHVPCRFSTPSGNIRCLWTPSPNEVTCEMLSRHLTYRLHPAGHAKAVHVSITARGATLPLVQEIVFPESLSCRDTRTTMTCNQDYGLGEFKLAPHGSRAR